MPIIHEGSQPVTLINLFKVEPVEQEAFLDLQLEQTEKYRVHMPGFLSSSFHCGLDGTRVLNLAQWRQAEDVDAARKSRKFRGHLDCLDDFNYSNIMRLYEVAYVNHRAGKVTIEADEEIIADIDVITVTPGDQDEIIRHLQHILENQLDNTAEPHPFSAALFRSLDGEGVVLYAQWRNDKWPEIERLVDMEISAMIEHDHRAYKVVSVIDLTA